MLKMINSLAQIFKISTSHIRKVHSFTIFKNISILRSPIWFQDVVYVQVDKINRRDASGQFNLSAIL